MKRKPINCKDMAAYLCENLTKGLNSPQCRELRRHLAGCPNCTAYLDSLKKTVYLYKHYRDPKLRGRTRRQLHAVLNLKTIK